MTPLRGADIFPARPADPFPWDFCSHRPNPARRDWVGRVVLRNLGALSIPYLRPTHDLATSARRSA